MADDKPDDKNKDSSPNDEALEKLTAKLAKAAGGADTGALKEIVSDFYRDAVDLRARNRELTRQITELKTKTPDGAIVLTGEDAKGWQALQKVGIAVGEIPKKLADGAAAQTEVTNTKRDKTADELAKIVGHNPALVRSLVRLHNLNIQIKEEADPTGAVDGEGKRKKMQVAQVIPSGENQQPVSWQDYVEKNLGDFRDALPVSEAERNGTKETPAGPRITRQRSGENGAGKAVTDEQLDTQLQQRHSFRV